MTRTHPQSVRAEQARRLVGLLQARFARCLYEVALTLGTDDPFQRVEWLRDGGRHGGGDRLGCVGNAVFDRASLNVSSVHYDDDPDKRLSSATALSCIVHPRNPFAPSIHLHESWTEMRDGSGYWRMMADLNPAIPNDAQAERFARVMREAAPAVYEEASAQGDRYFRIPALGRHRGVTHFYLEGYNGEGFEAALEQARGLGEAVIDCYAGLLEEAITHGREPGERDRETQLAYHTLYFFQVLTLDRGTTSGLLVHDQNDVGILGSLPSHVDRDLLASWASRAPEPQGRLVDALVEVLPEATPCPVEDETRKQLAEVVRGHYRAHPEALDLQARGDVVPATVANHGRV